MYPKNAASPEPIAIGAVIQISDGAVQTSGCTVRIKPVGVAEGDGGGTTAYSTDGIVLYTPTQAETDYTSFILIAKKTACIPASVTVITTSSATPGTVLLAPVTHTSAVVPTVTTATNVTTVNGLAADVITAASIAADAVTEIQSGLSTLTQTQVTGGAYALDSASFAFNSGLDFTTTQKAATLARVTLVDTTTTNTDMRGTDSAATAANLAIVAGYLDTEIAAILADTNELQTDWANGGRLDLILDTAAAGGGVTAEEIVDEIEARGITTVSVQSGVTSSTVLELVQGDTYDGTGKPLLSFTVAVDYTDGWTATLTIRDEDDVVISATTGTVASTTSITFSMTAPTGLTMAGCPGSWKGKFDLQMSKSSSRTTITRGTCYVYEDQTRT